jgi:hypothetical protein
MDIYNLAKEKLIEDIRINNNTDDAGLLSDKHIKKYFENVDEFFKLRGNIFKGFGISETCNPVSCRLIIFFTDTLIPYFINNIKKDKYASITIKTFSVVFNFIFYLIFDKFDFNEKKWIAQQINTIEKLINESDINYFKKNICINFEELRVKNVIDNNFSFSISNKEKYLNKSSKYYTNDVLLEELKKVLDRCLTFWKIINENKDESQLIQSLISEGAQHKFSTYFDSANRENRSIMLSPIMVNPDKIKLFPIKEYDGTIIFNIFSDIEELKFLFGNESDMRYPGSSDLGDDITNFFTEITFKKISERINQQLIDMKAPSPTNTVADLLAKIIFCFYTFIMLQLNYVFPKNKKYPETYDEIFTMFSNNTKYNIDTIKSIIYTTPINKTYYDFFVPTLPLSAPSASSVLPSAPSASSVLPSAPSASSVLPSASSEKRGGSIKKRILKKPKKTIRKTN